MKKQYLLNDEKHTLTCLKKIATTELNTTATYLIKEVVIEGRSLDDVAKECEVAIEVIQTDYHALMEDLAEKGFTLNKSNLTSATFNELDFEQYWSPTTAIVHIIQNCNSPCMICDCWKAKRHFHDVDVLSETFRMLAKKGASSVMISGGEPLLHPQLKSVLSAAKQHGLKIELNTNGILLHKFDWLAKFGINEIIISMDGIDAPSYKRIRGTNKFDRVWANIKRLKTLNPEQNIGIRTTLTSVVTNNLMDYLTFIDSSPIDYVGFSPLDTDSTSFSRDTMTIEVASQLKDHLLPSREECSKLFGVLNDPNSPVTKKIRSMHGQGKIDWNVEKFVDCLEFYTHNTRSRVTSSEPCNFPLISLLVDYDGALKNCFYSEPFGNIYQLDEVNWSAKAPIQALKDSNRCSDCRGKVFCE
ncbi:radical SAM protein [Vibrio sp.]|uniref:radical SAM protein n=1 Tax=Vibrio sp. TaxID=678 RepID=UPI00312018C3